MTANLKLVSTAVLLTACLLAQNGDAGEVGPSLVVTGNITLAEPSTATSGNIMKGTASFIHDFGQNNTFVGVAAGNFKMSGTSNTAIGRVALELNTTGSGNTASGYTALHANTTGGFNTASGLKALSKNTTGTENTASGAGALQDNTTGSYNTASGVNALAFNTTGGLNTASGSQALSSNTTGGENTASGFGALSSNTTGDANTASGFNALAFNTTGGSNTAIGYSALYHNTTGTGNIAIGLAAGGAITTGSHNIEIGTAGFAADDRTLRIGSGDPTTGTLVTAIAGIRGVTTGSMTGVPVLIDLNSQLGTASSSRRVKDHIADMGDASSALMRLRPVTFYYKSDRNPKGRSLQYGLVAEEVEGVMPGLVAHSAEGKAEAIYSQFLAPMLLNEVQKQQREIKRQAARLAKQDAEIAALRRDAERVASLLEQLKAGGMLTATR